MQQGSEPSTQKETTGRSVGSERLMDRWTNWSACTIFLTNMDWSWSGITPENSPIIPRNLGSTEIYSMTLDFR